MKKTLKSILVYALILFFVFSVFKQAVILPENSTYLALTILILSLTVMISCPLLTFLTVKCKFPTFFLMSTLLLTGILYLLKLFMVGFYVEPYLFEGLDLGSVHLSTVELIPIISIVLFSVVTSLLCSVYRELDD